MEGIFDRTMIVMGEEAMSKLKSSHVAVFGVGGVGGYALEAIVRSGVGEITIIDNDTVSVTNINRQIIALHSNIGEKKINVAEKRIKDINPDCIVHKSDSFFLPGMEEVFNFSSFSYIVDAIDTVSGKIALIEAANKYSVPIISSMGAGNKLDPTLFTITDIYKTNTDPLSRVMRRELKKRGIKKLNVVWSPEKPIENRITINNEGKKRPVPGSVAFVPSVAGLIIASKVITDLGGM